jgi:hypothetical protein
MLAGRFRGEHGGERPEEISRVGFDVLGLADHGGLHGIARADDETLQLGGGTLDGPVDAAFDLDDKIGQLGDVGALSGGGRAGFRHFIPQEDAAERDAGCQGGGKPPGEGAGTAIRFAFQLVTESWTSWKTRPTENGTSVLVGLAALDPIRTKLSNGVFQKFWIIQ